MGAKAGVKWIYSRVGVSSTGCRLRRQHKMTHQESASMLAMGTTASSWIIRTLQFEILMSNPGVKSLRYIDDQTSAKSLPYVIF